MTDKKKKKYTLIYNDNGIDSLLIIGFTNYGYSRTTNYISKKELENEKNEFEKIKIKVK